MGRQRIVQLLQSAEETHQLGASFAQQIQPNDIIALKGNLGAGKTTFMQGFLEGLQVRDVAQSPTFSLLQIYEGPFPIYHFDLYRIPSLEEFARLGFDEFLGNGGVAAIEWPEKIESLLPSDAWLIELTYEEPTGRMARITRWGER